MPEPIAPPAPEVKQNTAKDIAGNIVRGISDKANGRSANTPAPDPKAAPQKAPEATPDPNAGKEKYVVEGKDVWLTPEQARSYVQKGLAFEPRVSELDRLRNETKQFLETLKNDPARILFNPKIGLTPDDVFKKIMASDRINDGTKETVGQWYYENVVAPLKLSPQEREAMEAKKKLSEYEKRDQETKDNAIKQENLLRTQMALNQIKANISEAMKDSGLPDNDSALGTFMARRVADIMRLGYFSRQAVTPKDAIERVKAELRQIQGAWYDHLDEESLVKELGEKNAEKVKKYYLKLVKEAEKQPPENPSRRSPSRAGERKTMSPDEFRDYLDDLKKKG